MGFIYGVFVWIVMNLAVLPLVFQVPVAIDPKKAGIAMAILIVCIGMPISILINRYYSKKVNGQL
jgi:hypothetical protein